jgi:DNA-binding transcriptional ArsR family regulator
VTIDSGKTTLTTIRFHLPEDAIERVCFTYSAKLEAVFSLHVLVEPQRHPLHHAWIRRMRGLPLALRRELASCSFAFGAAPPSLGAALPDPLASIPAGPFESFEDGVAAIRALPAETVAAGLAGVVAIGDQTCTAQTRSALAMAHDDPLAFMERLCVLLEAYWEAAFGHEWERIEPHFSDSVAQAGWLMRTGGLYGFIDTLGPRVRARRDRQRFDLELSCAPQWGSAKDSPDVDVTVSETFTFVPTMFSWPHIWYGIESEWPPGMTYHVPVIEDQARPRVPPAELVRILRACGDDVRLRALRWIAERPRSTQELAPLIGITEPALSKHLRQLSDAGVLEPRRDGRYVLYHLRRDRLERLADSLLAFLDAGDQPGGRAEWRPVRDGPWVRACRPSDTAL